MMSDDDYKEISKFMTKLIKIVRHFKHNKVLTKKDFFKIMEEFDVREK